MKARFVFALLLVGSSAQAFFYDGNDLLRRLNFDDEVVQMVALGYVAGVSDANKGRTHCMPNNVTTGQLRDMVRNYLNNNPAERHYTAHSIVREVLASVFPCNRSGGKAL